MNPKIAPKPVNVAAVKAEVPASKGAVEVAKAAVSNLTRPIVDFFQKKTTHDGYKAQLRGMSDAELAAEQKRLEARIADASKGPVQDKDAVARAQAQLAEVKEEQGARAEIAKSKDPKYGTAVHGMDDKALAAEKAKQEERLKEATTGFDRDPKVAADAQAKLDAIRKEQFGRLVDKLQGNLPDDPATHRNNVFDRFIYQNKVSGMTDGERDAERARLNGVIRDATTGAHKDPVAAVNAREQLAILNAADTKAEGTTAGYKEHLRGETDAQLAAEQKKQQAIYDDATKGPHKDPEAAAAAKAKLNLIEGEQNKRAEIAKSKDPAYGAAVHGMDDKELSAERQKQEERYKEATTGADRDPARAADAKAKLDAINQESFSRTIDKIFGRELPKDSAQKPLTTAEKLAYRAGLRDDSDAALQLKKAALEAQIKDASSGANKDPGAVANAKEKLKLIENELGDRARIARGPQPEYGAQVHGYGDAALEREVAKQKERLLEATTGFDQDPKVAADAREKLRVLQAEVADRRGDAFGIAIGGLIKPMMATVTRG